MRLTGREARREMGNMNKIIFGKSGGKRPLERRKHRPEVNDNVKEIEYGLVSAGSGYGPEAVYKHGTNFSVP
jgi:hypothetical protein